MAHATRADDDGAIVGINVTPLVDITLVLLIIFIVTAKLIAQQGVPMDLPAAATAGATRSVFTISIDASGAVYADGAPIPVDRLRPAASRALAADRELRTVIQADGQARHAAVLRVVDELRLAGVTRIAFAADRAEAPGEP